MPFKFRSRNNGTHDSADNFDAPTNPEEQHYQYPNQGQYQGSDSPAVPPHPHTAPHDVTNATGPHQTQPDGYGGQTAPPQGGQGHNLGTYGGDFVPRPRAEDTVTLSAVQVQRPEVSSTVVLNHGDGGENVRQWVAPPPERPERRPIADEMDDQLERLRSEANSEQRTAWAYLSILAVISGVLVLIGVVNNTGESSAEEEFASVGAAATSEPARLVIEVNGDVVTVNGVVPDQATLDKTVELVQSLYGADSVLAQLEINPEAALDQGTFRILGAAERGDERPQALQELIAGELQLANRGFDVTSRAEGTITPVNIEVRLSEQSVVLSGVLPDQLSLDTLVALVSETWASSQVDASGLSTGPTSWENGLIRLVGELSAGQQIIDGFESQASERMGVPVLVDSSGLIEVDKSALATEVQSIIAGLLAANPVTFAPDSADIDSSSDAVIESIARELSKIPSATFQIVGHTDSSGSESDNQLLSERRAEAVMARLVELGVDPNRMSALGKGESEPISDDTTDEINRRIEFIIDGADQAAATVTDSAGDG